MAATERHTHELRLDLSDTPAVQLERILNAHADMHGDRWYDFPCLCLLGAGVTHTWAEGLAPAHRRWVASSFALGRCLGSCMYTHSPCSGAGHQSHQSHWPLVKGLLILANILLPSQCLPCSSCASKARLEVGQANLLCLRVMPTFCRQRATKSGRAGDHLAQ